jgi:hypothetical protein
MDLIEINSPPPRKVDHRFMFDTWRKRWDKRFISDGRVPCPLRSYDVEADTCAGCEWVAEVDEQAEHPFVRCQPAAR